MMRRLLTGLLGVTLLLGGCGDDDGDDRSAVTSIPDRTTTSSTTTTKPPVPPPDVIPEDVSLITEEYVEAVLDALYEVDLIAMELAREAGVVDAPSTTRLEATSTPDNARRRINELLQLASSGFEGMRRDPSPWTFEVLDVASASAKCISAEVRTNSTGIYPDSKLPDGAREFVRLTAATSDQLSSGLNPTAWVVDDFPVSLDGSIPDLACA